MKENDFITSKKKDKERQSKENRRHGLANLD
jgi:hypothetical protein